MEKKYLYDINTEGINLFSHSEVVSDVDIQLEYCIKNIRNPFNKFIFITHYFFGVEQKTICEVADMKKSALSEILRRIKKKMKSQMLNVNP